MSREKNTFDEQNLPYCPYFKKMYSSTKMYCEVATIRFPDADAKDEFMNSKCRSKSGCEMCQLYKILNAYYYERKYKSETD